MRNFMLHFLGDGWTLPIALMQISVVAALERTEIAPKMLKSPEA